MIADIARATRVEESMIVLPQWPKKKWLHFLEHMPTRHEIEDCGNLLTSLNKQFETKSIH